MVWYTKLYTINDQFVTYLEYGILSPYAESLNGTFYCYDDYSNRIDIYHNKKFLVIRTHLINKQMNLQLRTRPTEMTKQLVNNIFECYLILNALRIKNWLMKYKQRRKSRSLIDDFICKYIVYHPNSCYINRLVQEFD